MPDSRTSGEFSLEPVRFSRLSRRGVLLSLSGLQLTSAGIAVIAFVGTLYSVGAEALPWTSPIWGGGLAITWARVAGRPVVEWIPLVITWVLRQAGGQTVFKAKISRPRPAGTLALPGDAARLRQYDDPESNAVMIHDPHHATLTVACDLLHPSFVLLDPAEQERRIQGWGRVLSTACRSGRIARLQVLERTIPDGGTALVDWWREHGVHDDSWVARIYGELIEQAGPSGERHVSSIALALDMRRAAQAIRRSGGGIRGAAAVLRQEMRTVEAALRAADLHPSPWYDSGSLAVDLRSAYDPAIAPTLERHRDIGRSLATAGPVAVTESWGSLRTDSGYHSVLWVSEWPQASVYPGFMSPVILAGGIRRTVSITYEPVRTDRAARELRKRKVEHISDAAQRARMGQIEDAADSAELQDVLQQEADLLSGHGVLRYTGLISVSAPTMDELEAAVAQIQQAAIQSSMETRLLVSQQGQAFAAASLPLARKV